MFRNHYMNENLEISVKNEKKSHVMMSHSYYYIYMTQDAGCGRFFKNFFHGRSELDQNLMKIGSEKKVKIGEKIPKFTVIPADYDSGRGNN